MEPNSRGLLGSGVFLVQTSATSATRPSRLQECSRRTFSGSQQELPLSTISRKQRRQRRFGRLEMPPPAKEVPPGLQEPVEGPRWALNESENNQGRTFK